jgi:preprotein translocase subunit SecA
MRDVIYKMIQDVVADDVNMIAGDTDPADWNMIELNESLRRKIPLKPIVLTDEEKTSGTTMEIIERLQDEAMDLYHAKEDEFEEFARQKMGDEDIEAADEESAEILREGIREAERVILLKVIDSKWMNHIDDMDQLRQSIGLQSYAQKDPVVQYKFLGYEMFEEMTKNIRHDTVGALMHLKIEQKVEREQVAKATGTNKDDTVAKGPYRRKEAKIGRNAPCPCGSGKKYKQCHGRFA